MPTHLAPPAFPAEMIDALPIGVVHADASDRIIYVNREFFVLTECTPIDLEFMNFQDVLSMFCLGMACEPGPDKSINCPEDKWLAVEQYIRTSAGGLAWVRVRISTFQGPDGPVRQLLVEDVSKYKDLIDLLLPRPDSRGPDPERRSDPVCGFLPNWALTFSNFSFLRVVGRSREDITGEDFLSLMPGTAREQCRAAVESISLERPVAEVECLMRHEGEGPARREVWMRWVIQGSFYKTGHVKDYQAFGMDISEQKLAESRYIHADRLASLGAMVSGVAHEINNPNNFIMLNTPLLQDIWSSVAPVLEARRAAGEELPGGLPLDHVLEDVPQLIQGIQDGSSRIKNIVAELKNFGRRDVSGDFELLSFNEVVQSALSLMHKTIEKHTHRFEMRLDPTPPLIMGRRQRLEQIIVNLVHNACLALNCLSEAVVVETRRDKAAGLAILEVRDDGVGIPPEVLPHVTDPFYSTRHERGGAGLGLPISLSIVREHEGTLHIESPPSDEPEKNHGTLVRAEFPLAG
ncbi:hypothetical protein DPQ33_12300 [Oceanidesulfovibrio indonesiensis]|uniref:histidine kinase n=1 Tax=Oceanidesulfovibrio indonesiensis TaxID=54767 RepID=A0A7M3MDP0_9BACT|nr:ATP-binding protein [Oceanidesulfovibrio indonesiensis]TVM16396.1 hypothetical protein DPQ33_12300 [Oceanidesulfovibrio indonesiensis]